MARALAFRFSSLHKTQKPKFQFDQGCYGFLCKCCSINLFSQKVDLLLFGTSYLSNEENVEIFSPFRRMQTLFLSLSVEYLLFVDALV